MSLAKRKILQSSQDMFYWDFLNITKKDHKIIDIKFIWIHHVHIFK